MVKRLLDRERLTVHVLEPGGAAFISGPDLGDPEQRRQLSGALSQLAPDMVWVTLPHDVTVDVLSPALVTAILEGAMGADQDGQIFRARESADQTILLSCPRCHDDVRMSVVTTMTVRNGRLKACALVDPTDVEVHDLRCNG